MKEQLGFSIVVGLGLFVGLYMCGSSGSAHTGSVVTSESVEALATDVQVSSVLPGFVACISPEHIPEKSEAYDENLCMDTALLQGYPFDVDAISHTTLMVNFHLEDDQTAILYVSTEAIVGM